MANKVEETDSGKSKTIRLSTTISVHDLENKKRQAISFLKKNSILKFEIAVNKYDPENIKKGQIMLMNFADDLKSYAKMKVSPMLEQDQDQKSTTEQDSKSDLYTNLDSFETIAEEKQKQEDQIKDRVDVDEDEYDDYDTGLDFVYMELQSTVNFEGTDLDLDDLLENSTIEDFLSKIQDGKTKDSKLNLSEFKMDQNQSLKPEVDFDVYQSEVDKEIKEKLEKRVRMKKQLRKQSAIFDTIEQDNEVLDPNIIDLTRISKQEDLDIEIDDYDLLHTEIDPLDVESLERARELRSKIEFDNTVEKLKTQFAKIKNGDPEYIRYANTSED